MLGVKISLACSYVTSLRGLSAMDDVAASGGAGGYRGFVPSGLLLFRTVGVGVLDDPS